MYIRIRDLREDNDLTQKNIADYLGISREGYSKYEREENDIPTLILIKLAGFYNVTVDYLLGISDTPLPKLLSPSPSAHSYPRIKQLRKQAGIKQTEVAAKLNMSQNGYSNYETGKRDIPTDILIAIADFYNVSTDYILGRTDDPAPLKCGKP